MKSSQPRMLWLGLGLLGFFALIVGLSYLLGTTGTILGVGLMLGIYLAVQIGANPTLGLLLLLFFLPFERIPSVDVGGISLKINLFVGGLTLASTALAVATRQLRLRLQLTHWLSLGFIVLCLFGLVSATEQSRILEVTLFTFFAMALAWLVPQLLTTPALLQKALTVLFWSVVVVGVFGLYQFVGDLVGLPNVLTGIDRGFSKIVFGFPRIQAFSHEPLYLGNYLLLPLSLLFTSILSDIRQISKRALWGAFVLLSIVLVLTVARGAYIGAMASVLVIVLSLPREVLQPKHLLLGLAMFLVVATASYGFLRSSASNDAGSALENFQNHVLLGDVIGSESGEGRLSTFGQAYDIWRNHPWLGTGAGTFGSASRNFPDPKVEETSAIVNNEYLEILAETGLIGFLILAAMLGVILSRSVVALRLTDNALVRATLIGATAALIGMLVQYNFFSTLYIIHIWVTIGLLLAVQTIAMTKQQRGTEAE
jgi:O-antigen ligase